MTPKPVSKKNLERLYGVKAMTIAAGINCTDGILICADTEHTQGDAKFQKGKIFAENPDFLIVSGAGDAEFIKVGYDKLAPKVKYKLPADPAAARTMVEEATSKFHKITQLIIAVRCANDEICLIKTASSADGALFPEDYAAMGTGSAIFEYWAKYLLGEDPKPIDLETASHLMIFMVREAKGTAVYSGGSTHLYKMPRKAGTLARKKHRIHFESAVLAGFPKTPIAVLREAMNLRLADTEYEKRLEEFRKQIEAFRSELKNQELRRKGVFTETAMLPRWSDEADEEDI